MKINDFVEFGNSKLRSRNRIVMPPMDTLMANDGMANDFHIQHYGARSFGGVGTIIVESTAVLQNGMIRDHDLGLWKDEQIAPLKSVTSIVRLGGALIGIQLNHAGAKSEITIANTMGPTRAMAHLESAKTRHFMTLDDLKIVEDAFVASARRAKQAGFDFVEIHAAHGYLLSELLHRDLNELISGSILIRGKIVVDIIKRINSEIKIPVGIRVSFGDHNKDGMEAIDYKPLVNALENEVIYFHASSGETISRVRTADVSDELGTKLFRLEIAKLVKTWTKKPVITVGNYDSREDVEQALKNGIDLIACGRANLHNPNLVVNTLLTIDEIDKNIYHWNNNPWFNHHDYRVSRDNLNKKNK